MALPGIPKLPIHLFNEALDAAGVDDSIKNIQKTMAAKAAEIGELDIATLDPSALEAKLTSADCSPVAGLKILAVFFEDPLVIFPSIKCSIKFIAT